MSDGSSIGKGDPLNELHRRIQSEGENSKLDESATTEWFDSWHASMQAAVARSVSKVLPDESSKEETVQEVMVEIWLKADCYAFDESPLGWVTVVARRRAIDRLRSDCARVDRELIVHDRFALIVEDVAGKVLVRLDRERLVEALNVLSEKQRESIVLAFFGDRSYADVARLLNVPLGTVKRRIRDGLRRMQPLLSD